MSRTMVGRRFSDEWKRKISNANKGRSFTNEHKQKISEGLRGRRLSEEHKRRLSDAHKGKTLSEEHRRRISKGLVGKKHPPMLESTKRKLSELNKGSNHPMYGKHISKERKRKISEAHKGKKSYIYGKHHSVEVRKKISEGNKGKKLSEETKKKMNKFHKGMKYSEETRRKMSEAFKGRKFSLETRKKLSQIKRDFLKANPKFFKELIKRANQTPNKAEKILISLFKQTNLPYKYVGNGSFFVGRANPDFVNERTKKIIELFGEYWHTNKVANKNQTKEGRIEYFKKYGYATLVIWYNELRRNFPLTVEKIINFHNQP